MRVIEEERLFGSQLLYLVLHDPVGTEALAGAMLTLLPVDAAALSTQTVRKMVGAARHALPRFLQFKVALCGLPVSLGQSSLVIRPGCDHTGILAAVDALLRRLAGQFGTSLIGYTEFPPREATYVDGLQQRGYKRVQNLPVHTFPPQFGDFGEYLRTIRSTYRYSIRQSQKKLHLAKVRIERIEDPKSIVSWYTDEVHQLYLEVVERADYQFEVLTPHFFRGLASAFPGELTFSVARAPSGQVIGFLSSLRSLGRYHGLYMGLDYSWNHGCDLYYNLIYADLDYALRHGVRRIDLAQTADTFKARLGCRHEARYMYIRVRGGVLPRLLRWGLPLLYPIPDAVPVFHVFLDRDQMAGPSGEPEQVDGRIDAA